MPSMEQDAWVQKFLGVNPGTTQPVTGGKAVKGGGIGSMLKRIKKALTPAPPPPPVPRTEIGGPQTERANKLLDKMSPEDKKKVNDILEKANATQKKYLLKAIASQHSAAEIKSFYDDIAGKNEAWMEENLHIVGGSKGKGIKQQWQCSCGPTTIQALRGELDPIYALKLRKDNPELTRADDKDATKLNPNMAQEQKDMLEFGKGVATSRNKDGEGLDLSQALDRTSVKNYLGTSFDTLSAETDGEDKLLQELDNALNAGLPVPIRVGSKGQDSGHFVLVTGRQDGNPRRYSLHDPWEGKTITIDEAKIKAKKLNVAGWTEMTHIYKPTVVMPPN